MLIVVCNAGLSPDQSHLHFLMRWLNVETIWRIYVTPWLCNVVDILLSNVLSSDKTNLAPMLDKYLGGGGRQKGLPLWRHPTTSYGLCRPMHCINKIASSIALLHNFVHRWTAASPPPSSLGAVLSRRFNQTFCRLHLLILPLNITFGHDLF